MKLKPYPELQESKHQIMGKIPKHWELYRLTFLLETLESGSRETGGGSQLDDGVFSLGGEHIKWDGTFDFSNKKLISEEYYNSMNKGKIRKKDTLLVKDGATIGKTGFMGEKPFKKIAVNEHVFILRANEKIKPKLLYYLIISDSGFKQIKLTEVGSAQGGINQDFPAKVYFPIALEHREQNKILEFLDKKTSKINSLIEKNKKLINLLKEKRVALINHAVTKGLDPNVMLKDSGIDWIGEIPEHWTVVPLLKFISSKVDYRGKTPEKGDEGVFLVTGRNIKEGKINYEISKEFVKKEEYDEIMSRGKPKIGDVLFTTEAPLGEVANVDKEKIALAQRIIKFRGRKNELDNYFLKYYLMTKTFYGFLNSLATGSTALGIKANKLCYLKLIFPPLPEQIKIAEYLDKQTSKIDKIVKKIEQNIELLEEYKKSLIHHVVTGKVDVREIKV